MDTFKKIMHIMFITMVGLNGVLHILRIVYILFKPKIFSNIRAIASKNLNDRQLVLYYLLTITVIYVVIKRIVLVILEM